MPLTRLDNLISSKTGKYLYVSPDDFNATDSLSNRGNSPVTPFKSIQRAFLEIARYSYLPGFDNDRFDQFSIMLMPGIHYIDNRPGLADTTGIDVFGFANGAWNDNSILDISNPDNVLYKFNNTEGGAIIPRGSSLVGYDLRRTVVRPLYVPDPTSVTTPRSAIFNVTGGCYFWQFTIKDGQTTAESPLYDPTAGTGQVYYDPNDFTKLTAPNYSHHKLTVFEYADTEELSLFYRKIAKGFSDYQPTINDPGEFDFRVQENRIVGPLSDSRVIESLKLTDATTDPSIPASTAEVEVTTKVDHGYFAGQFVAISNTEIDSVLEGIFPIKEIDQNDPRKFIYEVPIVVSAIGNGLQSEDIISVSSSPALGQNAQTLAEVDSVESASPYVFNCSIRSTWGICGIWANGLKATGFKSMVIAQYTGVSLQKDDRAFIRYDEYSNTWNQASLTDAFATVPYHAKGDSYWKDDWRNFHVRASEDAFIQNVSIFAVGFADHFLMESGGDMSITNSNSNFGNTSLHAIGFKGFAFNQDKGGYVTDIIPPQQVDESSTNNKRVQYYTIDIAGSVADNNNYTKLFLGSETVITPNDRPAVTIDGYRLGAKTDEKLYVKLEASVPGGPDVFNATLEPTGFVKYVTSLDILNPTGFAINNVYADAANLIESNRRMIQEETFGYILEKYPRLQNISYVNPGRDPNANRFYDARDLIIANRQEIINFALNETQESYSSITLQFGFDDIGLIVDALAEDLRDGGNANVINVVSSFFSGGALSQYVGQEEAIIFAYNRAKDHAKKAIANLLSVKADLYDPNPNSDIAFVNAYNGTTTAGYTGSEAEELNLTTNGVTVDASNAIDPAGRFKDARNLIVENRQYILDNALAEIAVYHPDFYFPGEPQETQYSRFYDAYRFIRRNKDQIQTQVIADIQTQFPAFVFPGGTPDKCRRDIGYFIDAVGLDIFLGGNEYTRKFVEQYFTGPGIGSLAGEETETRYAYDRTKDLLNLAVSNQLTSPPYYVDLSISPGESTYGDGLGDVPNTDPTACADVQSAITTLAGIVDQVIADGDLDSLTDVLDPNYVIPTTANLSVVATKCRRDIGYIVDAIAQDLWFGGNEYTISATKEYLVQDSGNTLITNGVDGEVAESITAFKRIGDAINYAINNQLYEKDLTITLDNTGDPAIVSDINADAADLVLKNKEFIAKEAYERMKANFASVQYSWNPGGQLGWTPRPGTTEQDCLDDVYDVLEEVMYNVKFGGNHKTYDAANVYVTNMLGGQMIDTFIDEERDEAAFVFEEAKNVAIDVMRNFVVTPTGANTLTQYIDNTIVTDWNADLYGVAQTCADAVSAISTLMDIVIQAIGTDAGVGNLTGVVRTEQTQPTDYTLGNCSDVLSAVDTLISILCDALDPTYPNEFALDTGLWDCANVRAAIESLVDIAVDSIRGGTLADLPPINTGSFTTDAEASKCFRDVSYIVDAIVNDLRFGGNIASIQAAEAYYVGNDLEYIDGEKTETLDAWNYVGKLATAAMRNFDYLQWDCQTTANSAIVNVGDTSGIVIGMSVVEYYETDPGGLPGGFVAPYVNGLLQSGASVNPNNIPPGAYVKQILSDTEIELGVKNSRFETGTTVQALTTGTVNLYFTFENGQWADTLPRTVTVGPASESPDVIQDTAVVPGVVECANTASAIDTLVNDTIVVIINTGVGTVEREEPTVDPSSFASRATIFTVNTTGYGASNPHNFETGTPVRLVPRARFDTNSGQYVDVDKRLVRLPNGFETNRTYYVIAPGRNTLQGGTEYNNTTFFDGSDQTKLMLATSKENAAAGIYIYSSESKSIDPDVEVDMYQFVLDEKYDLHNYTCVLATTVTGGIQTDISHIFDVPNAATTPQTVFFRALEGEELPEVSNNTLTTFGALVAITDPLDPNFGKIDPTKEFYVKYQNDKVFTIHTTHADAISGDSPITFVAGQTRKFQVYANKRRSPVRFDPTFTDTVADSGKWYINLKDEASAGIPANIREENILWRIKQPDLSDRPKSTDMWFIRLDDEREADDRTYKIRYVIPKYLENARDPINGFVIKTRTDDTRKLVPQKILLKPVVGTVYGARFANPVQQSEFIGWTSDQIAAAGLNPDFQYDPYKKDLTNSGIDYRAFAKFNSGIQATIQSGRYVEDLADPTVKYLELTVFDHAVDVVNFPGLKNENFSTVEITAPQGGSFIVNNETVASNQVSWSGNSTGTANIHKYYSVNGKHYLIIKNIGGGKLEYSEYTSTVFTQDQGGGVEVFATMIGDQDMGKSLPLKTLIRKNYPEYFYKQNGANVYTITPGDRIQDDAGVEYYVDSVEDVGVIEDTFYVFSYETLQRRIAGQQDGIYYLSCLRGNISPFPTGAGVAENFRKFKFSQPVSSLYPLNYKNDPLWFKKAYTTLEEKALVETLVDPPSTSCAANNYIHGLVTTNDYKNSVTRELVDDLLDQPAFVNNDYTNTTSDAGGNIIDNRVRAQEGNATSGSEDRKIPIAGDSTVVSDQRYYVELRRPSIARAGNHTFEYLGFGPGNYSTGLPARQEIVLSPTEDFYAQSKKQDAGIVFYTGLNSNGDLYIGNRKINAITGEETFLEAAVLAESEDDGEDIGNLVTTFDTPVTFNQNITVVGGEGSLTNTFNSPIVVSVQNNDLTEQSSPLTIRSYVQANNPITNATQDRFLDRTAFNVPDDGDIYVGQNRVQAALFGITGKGDGQAYQVQTHVSATNEPTNITPNNNALVADAGDRLLVAQFTTYDGVIPQPGDVLLKGIEVGKSGSLGWIYANYYTSIAATNIFQIEFNGTNVVKVIMRDEATTLAVTNEDLGIVSGSQIRITNFYNETSINGVWTIVSPAGDAFSPTNNYFHIQVVNSIPAATLIWRTDVIDAVTPGLPLPNIEFSLANFKELGVIGAEALRTNTENIGDYKLGINTVARTAHSAALNGFVSTESDPRANLDVVGTAFISGKTIDSYKTETTIIKTETEQDNALLVGGESNDPDGVATLRVMTTNNGRVGINTAVTDAVNPFKELDKTFVVVGDARIHENLEITGDLEVNDGDITTTNDTFNFVNQDAAILNWGGDGQQLNLVNNYDGAQNINIGNAATTSAILMGGSASNTLFRIHSLSQDATVSIAAIGNDAANNCDIRIGGAWGNTSSQTRIDTYNVVLGGNLEIGNLFGSGTSTSRLFTQTRTVNVFDGDQTNTVNFATNATTLTMGSSGGSTTVRNSLGVEASATVEGNIILNGGLNAGILEISRGAFNTTIVEHNVGNVQNSNIDFYKYQTTGRTIDTPGASFWGSTNFLLSGGQIAAIDNITNNGDQFRIPGNYQFLTPTGGTGEGATFSVLVRADKTIEITRESPGSGYTDDDLLTLTAAQLGGGVGAGDLTFQVNGTNDAGTSYFLPISTPSVNDFQIGDLLLIDRGDAASPDVVGVAPNEITGLRNEAESEIVRVVGLANLTNPNDPNGFRLIVSRGEDGTGTYTNHPDGCVIAKLDKQTNASFITGSDLDLDDVVDVPESGISNNPANVRIGVAEFGGTISTRDYLRLSGSEIVGIADIISTFAQSLIVNDGGLPATTTFQVESTTGNTQLSGDFGAGLGFNRFTIDGDSGNTVIQGTLTTENTLTINGSTIQQTEFFTITNGGSETVPLRTTFEIDTANGNMINYGGDMIFYGQNPSTGEYDIPQLEFIDGDLTTYGSLSATGTGLSTFGGDLQIAGDIEINGGDLVVNTETALSGLPRNAPDNVRNVGDTVFSVADDGAVNIAGISNYFTRTGGKKWEYSADTIIDAESNINYFINPSGNTLIKLPQNALMGDEIRVIDISGNLTFNLTLVVRAPDNVNVQRSITNTGTAMLSAVPNLNNELIGWNGGELVVQTPNAGFKLVYAGAATPEGNPGVPSALAGWYLAEV